MNYDISYYLRASLRSVNNTLSEVSYMEHPLAPYRFGIFQSLCPDLGHKQDFTVKGRLCENLSCQKSYRALL